MGTAEHFRLAQISRHFAGLGGGGGGGTAEEKREPTIARNYLMYVWVSLRKSPRTRQPGGAFVWCNNLPHMQRKFWASLCIKNWKPRGEKSGGKGARPAHQVPGGGAGG